MAPDRKSIHWELFDIDTVLKKMMNVLNKKTILIMALLCTSPSIGQKKIITNLELFSSAVDGVVEEATRRIDLNGESLAFYMNNMDQSNLSRYITDRFFQGLIDKGVEVYLVSDTLAETIVISISVVRASVEYTGLFRNSFLGKVKTDRKAVVGLSLRVINGQTQRVEWAGELYKNVSDRISMSELDAVESDGILLGHPTRPKERGVRRWIEPALVLVTVGYTTYLFYSVRSQ